MGLKIYWTNFAKDELQETFSYYQENANIEVARRLVLGIENKNP